MKLNTKPTFIIRHYFDGYALIPIINAAAAFALIIGYRIALLNVTVELILAIGDRLGLDWRETRFPKWVERYSYSNGFLQRISVMSPMP